MVVNFGDAAAEVTVGPGLGLVFPTPALPSLADGRLQLPPHAGALLAPEV